MQVNDSVNDLQNVNIDINQDPNDKKYVGFNSDTQKSETQIADDHYIDNQNNLKKNLPYNKMACIWTVILKGIQIFFYMLSSWFFANELSLYIILILICSVDFWITKNITGRVLVGLRWWNQIDDDGNETWVYESYEEEVQSNPIEKNSFWLSQIFSTGYWSLIFILKLLSLSIEGVMVAGFPLTLQGTNLYSFYKCSKEHQSKIKNLKNSMVQAAIKQGVNQALKQNGFK